MSTRKVVVPIGGVAWSGWGKYPINAVHVPFPDSERIEVELVPDSPTVGACLVTVKRHEVPTEVLEAVDRWCAMSPLERLNAHRACTMLRVAAMIDDAALADVVRIEAERLSEPAPDTISRYGFFDDASAVRFVRRVEFEMTAAHLVDVGLVDVAERVLGDAPLA